MGMQSVLKTIGVATATVAGTAIMLVAPASAAPGTTSAPASVSTFTPIGAAEAENCPVDRYGYRGWSPCGSRGIDVNWGNNRLETFVVGTNRQVYHAWPGSGGWKSMGGWAWHILDARKQGKARIVAHEGRDHTTWCHKDPGNGKWSGTYFCG
ncbi:hypothetical protein GCM10010492_59380 [Saccharothrix mutabilis subsp. mutabilis]|uniref:Secreted protein n=1 Tax=Saccharothrix mutabilis subsp. mutabilis TaxID=66855 RepID=A0ABN0UHX7_9PSEU